MQESICSSVEISHAFKAIVTLAVFWFYLLPVANNSSMIRIIPKACSVI
jgi:hypothetical protein